MSNFYTKPSIKRDNSPHAFISARNVNLYLGQGAGSELYHRLKRARHSVKIVSPYIKAHFIDLLSELQQKGVRVTILTTEDVLERERKAVAYKLVQQVKYTNGRAERKRKIGRRYSLLGMAVSFALGIIGVISQSILTYAIAGVPASVLMFFYFQRMTIYSYSYETRFHRLKVFISPYYRHTRMTKSQGMMLHMKAFVIDDEAACLGSLNLTQEAFFDNYESCIHIDDRQAVLKITSLIDDLYEGEKLCFLDIQSWGKSLYAEPKN